MTPTETKMARVVFHIAIEFGIDCSSTVYILSFRNFLVIGLLSINLLILEGQVTFFKGKNLQKLHTSKLGRELKNVHFSRLFKNFREDPFKLTGDELAVIMNKSCYIALLTRTQSEQR